ncbi:SPOR domain-containing protein [Tabrizicola sp. BL-A-41-H6]|uniref:SPOR domain-containing protein n=1 Tax=Tabrizicola sp. BL-A-41-H6 TaxID=3421107 RepID=UPI003D679755
MADADFDGFGGGVSTDGVGRAANVQRYINMAGAAASVALVIGLGYWGYSLAMRDVRGVPVVQALDGPMRVAPENPGGEVVDNQGLSVNEVAAIGTAAPVADRLVLAPRPVELELEDAAGLAGQPVPDALPVSAAGADPDVALAADPVVESADPTEIAVAAALAEALAEEPMTEPEVAPELDPDLTADVALEGTITRSLRPVARPGRDGVVAVGAEAAPATEVGAAVAPVEMDAASIAPGTRLVQFGAYDTVDEAKAEWSRLQGRFGDLMAQKAMVVQAAESGGRTFFRLRAHGFEDEADARRFCAAFVAEEAACIPVAQR